eukprot:TRINITY_DN3906_c0_g1_i1.p1 TRINITY_DN3906_c0_g1~~TRINITY_DN3906_c0_g1_i1.p1  ORF type:complete len:173 (-),score=48.16 TRINITY_DN3906_c0_g1_i1:122-640(-)
MTTIEELNVSLEELMKRGKEDSEEELVVEAKEVLMQLNIEIVNLTSSSEKKKWKAVAKAYELQITEMQRKALLLIRTRRAAEDAKREEEHQHMPDIRKVKEELDASNSRQSQLLTESYKQLLETETVATGTMTELAVQRQKLERIGTTVDDINDDLGFANRLLNRMNYWCRC